MGFKIQVHIGKRAGAGELFAGEGAPRRLQNLRVLPVKLEDGPPDNLAGLQAELLQSAAFGEREHSVGVQCKENHWRLGHDGAQVLLGLSQLWGGFRLNAQKSVPSSGAFTSSVAARRMGQSSATKKLY